MPSSAVVSEWIEVRDANGRVLFLYSPLREVIQIKERGLTSEIKLSEHRMEWFEKVKNATVLSS
jgi:hypothetical protein